MMLTLPQQLPAHWADPKVDPPWGFCNLHHRSIRVQNWGDSTFWILSEVWAAMEARSEVHRVPSSPQKGPKRPPKAPTGVEGSQPRDKWFVMWFKDLCPGGLPLEKKNKDLGNPWLFSFLLSALFPLRPGCSFLYRLCSSCLAAVLGGPAKIMICVILL